MDDVIMIRSDDSDVEVIGFSDTTSNLDLLPLSEVRVDVEAVNVKIPPHYIDLKDPKWAFPELKFRKREISTSTSVIDLTDVDPEGIEVDSEQKVSEMDTELKVSEMDTEQMVTAVDTEEQNKRALLCSDKPVVKLERLPFLDSLAMELRTSGCSVHLAKVSSQMSFCFSKLKSETEARECNGTTASSSVSHKDPLSVRCPPEVIKSQTPQKEDSKEFAGAQIQNIESQHQQSLGNSPCSGEQCSVTTSIEHNVSKNEEDGFYSSDCIPSPTVTHSSPDKPHMEQLDLDKAESRKSFTPDHPSPHSPATIVDFYDVISISSSKSNNCKSQIDSPPISEHISAENTQEWDLETDPYKEDMGVDSPLSLLWPGESEDDNLNEENRFGTDFRAVSRKERQYVCPVALRKALNEPAEAPTDEDDESFGRPEVLCRQSLSLVYSTIDENYPEGTLQLLSDLIQPGYYPPKDVTAHLLRGILLDPQCSFHLCVEAFNLLMRTQRHHMATKSTVPWDWDLLTSVISSERLRCKVVRMFLEYVVQTLEDDFKTKLSISALHQSIAKGMLSCDQQFPRVRDVIKWLFSAIIKSTENEDSKETSTDRDEQIRLVLIFQRMLYLALEVDLCPALNSGKLSQELFHTLLSDAPLRAHRMLLLESLQSKLMRYKLLEHLLDYACPQKISVPMSLSLLLHFLKNCTLAPDPTDGTERWQKWEELVQLLCMLLLSYNKDMKGYLHGSYSEQRDNSNVPTNRVGTLVYKPDDMVSKPAVQKAVEAFLSRSRADLGQALPLHVEKSLTYLQDHLLDVCQC